MQWVGGLQGVGVLQEMGVLHRMGGCEGWECCSGWGGAAIQVEKAERELAMKKKQIIHIS